MGSLKSVVLAGTIAAVTSTCAFAADLPSPLPMVDIPPPIEVGGGWYLRGDIGITNQSLDRLTNVDLDARGPAEFLSKDFDSSPFLGVGVGYAVNDWIRTDVTGEYRGKANFKAHDRYFDPGTGAVAGSNVYTATKQEFVGLLNAYVDLGTWAGVTPFVGAGIGGAHVRIANFTDVNPVTGTSAFAASDGRWNLAWALYAGLGYDVTPNFKMEVGYRYLRLGEGRVGVPRDYLAAGTATTPWVFRGLESHDVKIGMRWLLAAPHHGYAPGPLIRKF